MPRLSLIFSWALLACAGDRAGDRIDADRIEVAADAVADADMLGPPSDVGPIDIDALADSIEPRDLVADATTAVPIALAAAPAVIDPLGGGGRVVVTVDRSDAVTGITFGGVALADFARDDATHVSGVPGPHAPGSVEVALLTEGPLPDVASGTRVTYWSPAELPGLAAFLDAHVGLERDGAGRVTRWTDRGPAGLAFTQDDPARRPDVGADPFVRFGTAPGVVLRLAEPVALGAAGLSLFAVARWTSEVATIPPPGDIADVPLTIAGDTTNAYGAFGAAGGAVAINYYVGGPVYVTGGADLANGRAHLIGATVDDQTSARVYVGAIQQGVDRNTVPMVGLGTIDSIGAGVGGRDPLIGDLGALVLVSRVLSDDERVLLDTWAAQRFGTPPSVPLDRWVRTRVGVMQEAWWPRDGAQMVALGSGRVLLLGGWNPSDPWDGDRVTNEVWASDDGGATWHGVLAHDPTAARFAIGHTFGAVAWRGHAVVIGTDPLRPPYLGDVWHESDEGLTWTRVATDAPTLGRCFFMTGTLGDDLYVMGGQTQIYDPTTGLADVWRSHDGGVTWEELAPPPWSPRGISYRPVESGGRLFVIGGGLYSDRDVVRYNGVFAFDGETWQTVLPDGHDQFAARIYHSVASFDGRLVVVNGYDGAGQVASLLTSDDGGRTWSAFPGGAGGDPSEADALVALPDRLLRISGNLGERAVHAFRRR